MSNLRQNRLLCFLHFTQPGPSIRKENMTLLAASPDSLLSFLAAAPTRTRRVPKYRPSGMDGEMWDMLVKTECLLLAQARSPAVMAPALKNEQFDVLCQKCPSSRWLALRLSFFKKVIHGKVHYCEEPIWEKRLAIQMSRGGFDFSFFFFFKQKVSFTHSHAEKKIQVCTFAL